MNVKAFKRYLPSNFHQSIRTKRHLANTNQNQFYFEPSILVKNEGKETKKNSNLYQKVPVVLILGWTGSQDNHVRKYERVYSEMGYHTIRFAPSHKLTFLQPRLHLSYAMRLISMIHELGLSNNSFITHQFSNAGGFIVYQHLLTSPEGEFFKRNHKSAIFDCALGVNHKPIKLFNGINSLLRTTIPNTPLRYIWASGIVAGWNVFHHANRGNHYFTNMIKLLENDPRPIPTLFMYTRRDTLLCPDSMSRFVEKRKSGGFHIEPVVYDDCDHVSIYLKHPEDYFNRIRKHLLFSKMDLKTLLQDTDLNSIKK